MENKNKYDYWMITCAIAYIILAIFITIFTLYYCIMGFPAHVHILERIAIIAFTIMADAPFLALFSKD